MELLGKAVLAYKHPSLIVDPNEPTGFLVAINESQSTDFKIITAKTVFESLQNLVNVPRFDADTKKFCMTLANLRNEELHSGALPFVGTIMDHWLPKFWDVCKIVLVFQNKTLRELLGPREAEAAEKIIQARSVSLKELIEARILRHRTEVRRKYEGQIPSEVLKVKPLLTDDDQETINFPSCGGEAIIYGEVLDEGSEYRDEEEPWIVFQDHLYEITSLKCRICDLKLNNLDEVIAAGLHQTFEKTVTIEPDYEPDYGND
ncbi:hypothetical protein ACFSR7_01985 [Cohnella sp. GCM10020058]|uniref:hypothetical protein n=1 Tax=Cohnella sp. GCM10020058 TaxID=3317330 RepID=UPI003626B935